MSDYESEDPSSIPMQFLHNTTGNWKSLKISQNLKQPIVSVDSWLGLSGKEVDVNDQLLIQAATKMYDVFHTDSPT